MDNKKQSIFEILGAGKSFGMGIVMAFLVIFSIGFFVLLFSGDGISLNNKADKALADFNKPAAADDAGTQPADNTQPTSQINIKPVTSDDHIRGDVSKAGVILVEFSDIDCPYCARFHPTLKQIMSDYNGQVAWVYRHFPLDSLHPQTRAKAEASECVYDLGGDTAFWKFLDKLYESDNDDLPAFAQAAGVNVSSFNDCVDSNKFADKVQSQYQDAVASGGRGTPYSVVLTKDGQRIPINGALAITDVKQIIDPLLQ